MRKTYISRIKRRARNSGVVHKQALDGADASDDANFRVEKGVSDGKIYLAEG